MSLFDKLRSALDMVEKKMQNTNQSATLPSANQPCKEKTADMLADETVKNTSKFYAVWDRRSAMGDGLKYQT